MITWDLLELQPSGRSHSKQKKSLKLLRVQNFILIGGEGHINSFLPVLKFRTRLKKIFFVVTGLIFQDPMVSTFDVLVVE